MFLNKNDVNVKNGERKYFVVLAIGEACLYIKHCIVI